MWPRIFENIIFRSKYGYKIYLNVIKGYRPRRTPNAPWHNAVLKSGEELRSAAKEARSLSLPPHAKVWDDLAILDYILKNIDRKGYILDAGSSIKSRILVSLFLYGYDNLTGINLEFKEKIRKGTITYEHGDITGTRFPGGTFDAIICQSVIEHGVDPGKFFTEASRILKKGGALIVTTDYYKEPIDTIGKTVFGLPWKIFSEDDIKGILAMAAHHGFEPTGPLDLECEERPVRWLGLNYTFLIFTLRKNQ